MYAWSVTVCLPLSAARASSWPFDTTLTVPVGIAPVNGAAPEAMA